jgi:hypothetical protein
MSDELTSAEQELIETLPGPPELAEIRASNVWIVEWLPAGEPQTVTERSNAATEERLRSGHAVGGVSIL